MKLDRQRTSESVVKLRKLLERDIEADKEEWSELVRELIPLNLRQEWGEWIKKNINELLSEGIEKQSEVLIMSFLSCIDENNKMSKSEENNDDEFRKYGQAEVRDGQSEFSSKVRDNCNNTCVVTGCRVASRLQAAHICSHNKIIDYSISNGLLLRADIHLMLDQGDCAIDPVNKTIHFKRSIINMDSDLEVINGKVIKDFKTDINWNGFEEGWIKYNQE